MICIYHTIINDVNHTYAVCVCVYPVGSVSLESPNTEPLYYFLASYLIISSYVNDFITFSIEKIER